MRVLQGPERVQIVIRAVGRNLLIPIAWTAAGLAILSWVIDETDVVLMIFFAVWVVLVCLLCWAVFGREVVTVEHGVLSVAKVLFGMSFTRRYEIASIDRVAPGESGQVEFACRGRKHRFGANVRPDDAVAIVDALSAFIIPRG